MSEEIDTNQSPEQSVEQSSVASTPNTDKIQEISEFYQEKKTTSESTAEPIIERSPIDYYIGAFRKYADFSGRARRSEYWWFILGDVIINTVLWFINIELIYFLFNLATLIPLLAVTARRLHDVGKTGWLQLLGIIASIVISISALLSLFLGFAGGVILFSGNSSEIGSGILGIAVILAILSLISVCVIIWLFILYIKDSTPGTNKYGPNPKGIES